MLTKKEIEVLTLKKKGMTQEDIAKKLEISQPAVSNFLRNAYSKIKEAEETIKISKEMGIKLEE